ncbi:MAG: hypothetical protein AUG51_01260 [Acidobacteria bacterium 13_1_20CM_3_53_8]|nr:MAG: hypothetical protein AUG51_01260 [Acidobacteria bacterium 13_1_20CM_3_53_8]
MVVPVRNEENSICELLDGLLSQTRAPDEIVITDGGSTDSTASIIEGYIERAAPIRLIRTGGALPGRGRNLATAQATCEWIAFTDAGIRPAKDWLEALARRAESDDGVEVVYGLYEPVTDSLFKECAAIAYVPPPVEVDGAPMRPRFIASALMRRDVWRAVGGFPEHLRSAEDLLFMDKVEEANFRTAYEPRALVKWDVQPTLWRTFKRFVTYSRNNIRAGLWSRWQSAIFRRYAVILLSALPALVLGRWWLYTTLALWLLLLVIRACVALWRNQRSYPASAGRNILRLPVIVSLLAVLDAATIVGSLDWFLRNKLHLMNEAEDASLGA